MSRIFWNVPTGFGREDGRLLATKTGTGQGQVISPLLANIYLHYVLDEWFETVVKPRLKGRSTPFVLPMTSFPLPLR